MFQNRLSKPLFWLMLICIGLAILSSCGASYRTYRTKAELERLKTPTVLIEGVKIDYRDTLQYPNSYTPDGKPVGSIPITSYSFYYENPADTIHSESRPRTRVSGEYLRKPVTRPITFKFRRYGTFRF